MTFLFWGGCHEGFLNGSLGWQRLEDTNVSDDLTKEKLTFSSLIKKKKAILCHYEGAELIEILT